MIRSVFTLWFLDVYVWQTSEILISSESLNHTEPKGMFIISVCLYLTEEENNTDIYLSLAFKPLLWAWKPVVKHSLHLWTEIKQGIRLIPRGEEVWTEQQQADVFINSHKYPQTFADVSGRSDLEDDIKSFLSALTVSESSTLVTLIYSACFLWQLNTIRFYWNPRGARWGLWETTSIFN